MQWLIPCGTGGAITTKTTSTRVIHKFCEAGAMHNGRKNFIGVQRKLGVLANDFIVVL